MPLSELKLLLPTDDIATVDIIVHIVIVNTRIAAYLKKKTDCEKHAAKLDNSLAKMGAAGRGILDATERCG